MVFRICSSFVDASFPVYSCIDDYIYNKKPSALAVASSVLLFSGAFCVAIEIMVNINFHIRNYLIWSFYPLITLILLAIILIIIDHNDVLKEKLEKKFFI